MLPAATVHAAGRGLTCAGALDWNGAAVVVALGVTHDAFRVAELALEQVAPLDAPLVAACLAECVVAALAAAMVPAALMVELAVESVVRHGLAVVPVTELATLGSQPVLHALD